MKVTDKKIDFITLDLGKYEEKDLMRVLFDTVEKASEEMVFITTPEFAQAGMKYMQKLASFDEQGVDMILPQNFDGHILMLGAIYKKSSLISISNLLAEGESNIEELIYESWAKVVTARELENLGDLLPMDSTKGILSRYLGRSSAADPGSSNNVGEGLILQLLPWNFSVCKIEAEQEIPLAQDYFFTGKTEEEYSLVCPTDQIPVQTLEREDGWRGFRIKDILENDFTLPSGVRYEIGGEPEKNLETVPEVALGLGIALVIIFFFLLFNFRRFGLTGVCMASILLSLPGAMIGLGIADITLGLTSLFGFITLMGIIMRNEILIFEHADQMIREGLSVRDAAFDAGRRRMVPIFLTTATTAVGVIPMILGGSSFWVPVGITIFAGGIGTLILVVTVLPVVYWKLNDKKSEKNNSQIS